MNFSSYLKQVKSQIQETTVEEVQKKRPAVHAHGSDQMLGTLQADTLERAVERAREQPRQLHQRHAQVLGRVPREAHAGRPRERRIGPRQVVEGKLPATAKQQVGDVAEAATEPKADRQRQPTDRGQE